MRNSFAGAWTGRVFLVAALLGWGGAAGAGSNDTARAFLSWSRDAAIHDVEPDQDGQAELVLRVEGARDVARISNEILWSAQIPHGAALIWPEPRDAETQPCGVTNGHPGRRGTITFAGSPGEDFCVVMKLRVEPPTAAVGARFRPGVVVLEDSFGSADTLEIEEEGVTLNSGREAGFAFVVTGVEGESAAGGLADTLRVRGFGFESGTQVALRAPDSGRTLVAHTLNRSWTEMAVEISPGTGDSGDWRVVVENPSGIGFADSARVVEIVPPSGGPRTWSVPGDFAKVQAALDAAAPGDTVQVGEGIFENDHAWIVDKDRVVLRGAGADRTVVRGNDDTILAVVRSEGVEVTGIAFVLDNEGIPLRVPMQLADAGAMIEGCVFAFRNCRVCSFISTPRELRFLGNTVIRAEGEGSNLFARVSGSTRDGAELTNRIEIRQVLSIGFDASFDCETPVAITAECNGDPGHRLVWFGAILQEEVRLENPESLDFRPVEGSAALPEGNSCGLLLGAVGR